MKKTARVKLAERNIHWEEAYTETTLRFKQMYKDIVGDGSYFRWEGKDYDTGDEYFVIVSPAKIKNPESKWFAGCRKLPSDWSAGGKYFAESREALNYAKETWGTPPPADAKHYSTKDLKDIAKKVDEWREAYKENKEAQGENGMYKFENYNILLEKNAIEEFKIFLFKEATRGRSRNKEEGYSYFDVKSILTGNAQFEEMAKKEPFLEKAKQAAYKEENRRRNQISRFYGPQYVNADFYKLWLAHKPGQDTYLVGVSPYCGCEMSGKADKPEAYDKFDWFVKRLNVASQGAINEGIDELISAYEEIYGITLSPEDLNVSGTKISEGLENIPAGPIAITLDKEARKKIYQTPTFKKNLEYYMKPPFSAKNVTEAQKICAREWDKWKEANPTDAATYDKMKRMWFKKRTEEYKKLQESGMAFTMNVPPPPRVDILKRGKGQQGFTAMTKEEREPQVAGGEGVVEETTQEGYGCDSFQEALEKVLSNTMQGFPLTKEDITSIPNVTSEQLKTLRETNNQRKEQEKVNTQQTKDVVGPVTPEPVQEQIPEMKVKDEIDDLLNETPQETIPEKAKIDELEDIFTPSSLKSNALTNSLLKLVHLASVLDKENKFNESEEIHKILRKYIRK